eukprot:3396607-Pleurochrysis_carterae.AAC.1
MSDAGALGLADVESALDELDPSLAGARSPRAAAAPYAAAARAHRARTPRVPERVPTRARTRARTCPCTPARAYAYQHALTRPTVGPAGNTLSTEW